jgi:hypothetical protein
MSLPPTALFLLLVPFILFFVIAPAAWLGIVWLTARLGGWAELAKHYRCSHAGPVTWRSGNWVKVGMLDHQFLSIAIEADGLYLKTEPLSFLAFHPTLRIPWDSIRIVEEEDRFGARVCVIWLTKVHLTITMRTAALRDADRFLGEKLKLLAKQDW